MITTARKATRAPRGRGARAFTLVEFMIGSALGSMVLLATLTAFIFFCRGGVSMSHYADMERQSRVTLQTFSQDSRQASGVVWVDENTLRLTLNGTSVTYSYRPETNDFVRTANETTLVLASGIESFQFKAYDLGGTSISLSTAAERTAAVASTNMVQVNIALRRNPASTANASAQTVSARYILRNKRTV